MSWLRSSSTHRRLSFFPGKLVKNKTDMISSRIYISCFVSVSEYVQVVELFIWAIADRSSIKHQICVQ